MELKKAQRVEIDLGRKRNWSREVKKLSILRIP
jgi:hypothetical protein